MEQQLMRVPKLSTKYVFSYGKYYTRDTTEPIFQENTRITKLDICKYSVWELIESVALTTVSNLYIHELTVNGNIYKIQDINISYYNSDYSRVLRRGSEYFAIDVLLSRGLGEGTHQYYKLYLEGNMYNVRGIVHTKLWESKSEDVIRFISGTLSKTELTQLDIHKEEYKNTLYGYTNLLGERLSEVDIKDTTLDHLAIQFTDEYWEDYIKPEFRVGWLEDIEPTD